MEYDVGQEVGSTAEVVAQDRSIVDGLLLSGVGIEVATYALKPIGDMTGTTAVGALKCGMFYKMSHARIGTFFVARASTHYVATVKHRRYSVLHDEA